MVPLFKNGDAENVGNYRPISLLPILSKVLEKIIAIQLMEYLESNKLLSNSQHGFRSKLSTETALMKVNEHIYNNIDNKKISLLLLLDLSKAFDSVSHDILFNKMHQMKINSFWFKDYLKNRVQSVKLNGVMSSPKRIDYGVPQGSILGPILFIIYINDMAKVLSQYFLVQYADDCQIIISGLITEFNLLIKESENALKEAKLYFKKNGLNINEQKTQCIIIGSRQLISSIPVEIELHFGEAIIKPVSSVKNLGLYMDQYLLYDVHINYITRKVNGILMFLNRIKDNFDKATRIMIVQSLALSTINYCLKIWGMTTKQQLEKIQKLQNFAAKIAIGGARKYDHVTPILKELKWVNIENKILYDICTFTYKVINNVYNENHFCFPTLNDVNIRLTRQSNDLFIKRTNTDIGTNAISIRGPKLWNTLPADIKDNVSFNGFKSNLTQFLLIRQNGPGG